MDRGYIQNRELPIVYSVTLTFYNFWRQGKRSMLASCRSLVSIDLSKFLIVVFKFSCKQKQLLPEVNQVITPYSEYYHAFDVQILFETVLVRLYLPVNTNIKNILNLVAAKIFSLKKRSYMAKKIIFLRIHGSIPDMRRKLHDQLFSTSGGTFYQWGTFYQQVTFHHQGKF